MFDRFLFFFLCCSIIWPLHKWLTAFPAVMMMISLNTFFFFYESLKCLVPWLQLGKCLCLVFEAQEDQSETSQQTAASDEEQETENQVLSDQMSVGLLAFRLGNFHQLQLISDYRHDYSQWVMRCVFISLFSEFEIVASFFWSADHACTVVSSWWLIAKWLTRNKWLCAVLWEG